MTSPHHPRPTGSSRSEDGGERSGPARAEPTEEVHVPPGGRPADYRQPARTTALNATKSVGRGIGKVGVASARATAATSRFATTKFHAYTHAGGAGESGLARLSELHVSHTAGDAAMMLALAGTLFFNPQVAQAREQVALFLVLTMVPFTLVAPFIGPLLDRLSHGRRWAIGVTMASRAFLCWVLAEAINNDSSWLFPAALGCLVASKAYNITRAAAVPRLLPLGTTLVQANSRISMSGVLGAVIGGGLAGAAMKFGPSWALRVAFVLFIIGTVQAIRLPDRIDNSVGELDPEDPSPVPLKSGGHRASPLGRSADLGNPAERHTAHGFSADSHEPLVVDSLGLYGRFLRRVRAIPWPVLHALWSTGGTRFLTGFLIMFMAFLAKAHPIDGMRGELVLAFCVIGIGVGNALGSVLGTVLQDHKPERVAMLSVLLALITCIATAIWYGVWTLIAIGLVQGLTAQLAKLCLDALVQREVPENVRTSVFAWSETMLQMMWVAGGALGIILPLNPYIGFPVAAVGLLGSILMAARARQVGLPARPRLRGAT
ncbi:MAG: MFS transporter [Dermatophilaceae bacterium]